MFAFGKRRIRQNADTASCADVPSGHRLRFGNRCTGPHNAGNLALARGKADTTPAGRRQRLLPFFRLSALTVVGILAFAPLPANACFRTLVDFIGTPAEEAAWQKQAEQERMAAAATRRREFREAVRTGKVDSADHLAALLIPNVREWYEDISDCGPGGDFDGPPMPRSRLIADALIGSELDGLGGDLARDALSPRFVRASLWPYRRECSDELRARFSDRLRNAVPRRERDRALLSLSGDGKRRTGLYRFADVGRTTRPIATFPNSATAKAGPLADDHHPVTRALNEFWRDVVPQLGSPALTCPAAFERLVAARDADLERMRRSPGYTRLLKRAAGERSH